MEKATHNNVDPIQYEASRFVEIYVALIDGLSPGFNWYYFDNTIHFRVCGMDVT
jgi:hypothetical protein